MSVRVKRGKLEIKEKNVKIKNMKIYRIFNSQAKTITFAAILLAISAGISGILGLIREGLLAGYFGVWGETNSYFAAFRINDFFYNLLIVGGLSVAFLPLFSEYYAEKKEKGWEMVNYLLNSFLIFLILSSLLIFIFSSYLVRIVTPGFSTKEQVLTANLVRIMILSPIFFGLSAIFSGILQYFNRFLIFSIAPILYNLGIIFGILFLRPYWGIFGVAMGVVLGAASHWIIQIPSVLNCGFKYRFAFSLKYPAIGRVFFLALPRIFAIASQQINLIVVLAVASTISGGVAIFSFANNLQGFPISILAIPFAIAVFPTLAKNWAENQKKEFLENFSSIFRQILFLLIPLNFFILILRTEIVRLILGTLGEKGKFDWPATQLTATSLGLFSISLVASALIPYLSRAFFSFQDTKTPTLIAIFFVTLNVILSFSLIWLLRFSNGFESFFKTIFKLEKIENISILGLPLAFSIATIFQFIFLLIFLYQKIGDFKLKEIFLSAIRVFLFSLLATLFSYLFFNFVNYFLDTQIVFSLFLQTILTISFGLFIYFGLSFFFKSPELFIIFNSLKKQFRKEII